jgi:hypothetical protein
VVKSKNGKEEREEEKRMERRYMDRMRNGN